MAQNKINFIFGPIPSRRLGRSLGVSLLPFKTCSMDCIYCECGATTSLTEERGEYQAPLPDVLEALEKRLQELNGELDYVTFSGVGEPLLHSGVGRIIDHIKTHHPELKVCLLTNGSVLTEESGRKDAAKADLVIASLDGSNEEEFRKINRPAPGLTLEKLVEGFILFRKEMKQRFLLEIFIVPGINDSDASCGRFRRLAERIAPDAVELNALDRPGAENWVQPAASATLEKMAEELEKVCKVEFIASGKKAPSPAPGKKTAPRLAVFDLTILSAIADRPLTVEEMEKITTLPAEEIKRHLPDLEKKDLLVKEEGPCGICYRKKEVKQ